MYTYIIIDDEELIRKGTIKKISPMSDRVTCIGEAGDGAQGIELISKLQPDFVILDMQMPEMDGMELLPYLNSHYPALPLIVISGYRNFDYIKQAISANAVEYLLKPFSREMIQNCVSQIIESLDSRSQIENQLINTEREKEQACYDYDIQLLYNLILGYHVSGTTLTSRKLNAINDTHNLMLLTLHFAQPFSDSLIQGWLDEHGFGDLALYISGAETTHLGFIVLFLPRHASLPDRHLADQILDSLLPWIEERQTCSIAGISQTHSNLLELNAAYHETSQALNHQHIGESAAARYFYSGDAEPRQLEWERTDEFLFRIEAGMEAEVREMTQDLFDYYTAVPGCTLADVKYHCYQLSDQCHLILNEYLKVSKTPETSSSMQNVISHIFTMQELKEYYLRFFLNLTAMIKPQSVYAVDDTIEKIQIYMRRNIQKNLTQEYIASLFCINRSYLSTLFKARTGRKFVDYLNDLRIERAEDLLRHSDRKMYQIAKNVGYDNIKYFFRVFKKRTGMTPEQFRNQ